MKKRLVSFVLSLAMVASLFAGCGGSDNAGSDAGNNAAAVGFARLANSDDFVYIAQQRDGKWRVIGNESFETNTNPSQDSGMAETDASGTTLEISVTDVCPAPFYVGKLKTSDGTLDCATNTIEEATAQG